MAGHMGNRTRTTQNLLVMRVDPKDNLIYLKGSLAGAPGGYLRVRDAIKKCVSQARERERRTALGLTDTELEGVGNGVTSLPFPAGTKSLVSQMQLPDAIMYKKQ